MFNKRGQAAMEFLMTYGWAILAAVIVVGVLWYMIGNPANLAGTNFQMSAPFPSNGVAVSASQIGIEFRNGASESVDIQSANLTNANCNGTGTASVAAGDITTVTMTCSGLSSGDRIADTVTIYYTKGSGTLVQTATGSITGVVP